MPYKWVKNG